MKKILFLFSMLAAGMMFVACSNEDYTLIPATFKGFEYAPNPAVAGDTLTISAVYRDKGAYVNKPRCSWRLTLDTLNAKTGVYDKATLSQSRTCSIGDEKLTVHFALPKSTKPGQTASCTFNVDFDVVVNPDKVISSVSNVTEEGYVGTFDPSIVAGTLVCKTSGRLQVKIK